MPSGQTVAVKVLSKFKDANKQQKMIDSEMNAKLVAHQHIVKVPFEVYLFSLQVRLFVLLKKFMIAFNQKAP